MWAGSDFACPELSFPPFHFVHLRLSGFLMNGKKHLKSNMSKQLPLTKYNPDGFWLHSTSQTSLPCHKCFMVLISYCFFSIRAHFSTPVAAHVLLASVVRRGQSQRRALGKHYLYCCKADALPAKIRGPA